ncbi:MAG: SLBB domain-containing protein [Phycisphaerales bacterium]|nr:MAG: SLBB domain-containing protein [Phycisphaerales bacterium]
MNFAICECFGWCGAGVARVFRVILITFLLVLPAGCGDQVRLPSAEELVEFERAGPSRPTVDLSVLSRARIARGPYRVLPGEVLELTMPTILKIVTAEEPAFSNGAAPFVCRVSQKGSITLPVVGEIAVAGKTLAEIEVSVIDAYHPRYAVTRPSVFARVVEYRTAKVCIQGAVARGGVYELRSDQMSLVSLLMEAGGIVDEGAAVIRVVRSGEAAEGGPGIRKTARLSEEGRGIVLRPRYINSDQRDIRVLFAQAERGGTKGELRLSCEGEELTMTNFDISDELHRRGLIRYLDKKHRRFSDPALESELIGMAEELEVISVLDPARQDNEQRNPGGQAGGSGTEPGGGYVADEGVGERLVQARGPERGVVGGGDAGEEAVEEIVLPVKGLNIPFSDVALREGDSVLVERLEASVFSVIGLVRNPGNFPYPPDARYNLMQAIAFAGGLDQVAEPRYATVYRLKADGTIVRAPFQIISAKSGSELTSWVNVVIKPGDIVAVEQTARTRSNLFLANVFRLNVGAYISGRDLWNND